MIKYRAKREQSQLAAGQPVLPACPSSCSSFLLLSHHSSFSLLFFFSLLYLSLSFLLCSSAQTRLWPSRWRVRLWDLRAEQWLENAPFWEQLGQNGRIQLPLLHLWFLLMRNLNFIGCLNLVLDSSWSWEVCIHLCSANLLDCRTACLESSSSCCFWVSVLAH